MGVCKVNVKGRGWWIEEGLCFSGGDAMCVPRKTVAKAVQPRGRSAPGGGGLEGPGSSYTQRIDAACR